MAPTLLFDHDLFEAQFFFLQVIMLLGIGMVILFFSAANIPLTPKALLILVFLVGFLVVVWQTYSGLEEQRALRASIAGGVFETTGIATVIADGEFSVGETEFRIAPTPQQLDLEAGPRWANRFLRGQCVRVRYTTEKRIVWLGVVNADSCSTQQR